jgi:acyl dehydratase
VPIDPAVALGAELPPEDFAWSASDVLLYHLALGAGRDPLDARELRYTLEDRLQVLPTFAVVAQTVHRFEPPAVEYPGISIDLAKVLHGTQRVDIHRPLPADGKARATSRVKGVYDKGAAAVIETETVVTDLDGTPIWTNTSSIFARGEGGFGGDRGPAGPPLPPDRDPDAVLITPTVPQQALWYRLLGDRNPLHSHPEFAELAGFPRPILHGLCTYGTACRSIVSTVCNYDADRIKTFDARFSAPVFPGETIVTEIWIDGSVVSFRSKVRERDVLVINNGKCTLAA